MKAMHIPGPAPLYTNTFLLVTEAGHGIVIDAAASAQVYLDAAREQGAQITHILLTHGHYDHVGGVQALAQATGAAVYLDAVDAKGDQMFPLPPQGDYRAYPEELQIDELTFRVWHTPGHTKGSRCLWCGGLLFSGDTLFAGSCGRVDLPGGDAHEMMASLSLLANLPLPDDTQVCPGHEGFSTLGRERRSNPYLQEGLQW